MIGLVFLNVILRYFFETGLVWSEEVARLCFIYLVYLGTVGAARENRHLGVETILEKVPGKLQKGLYTAVQLIILWVMVLLVQASWALSSLAVGDNWVATGYPRSLIYAIGVLTGVAIGLIALANLYRLYLMRLSVAELIAVPDQVEDDVPRQMVD